MSLKRRKRQDEILLNGDGKAELFEGRTPDGAFEKKPGMSEAQWQKVVNEMYVERSLRKMHEERMELKRRMEEWNSVGRPSKYEPWMAKEALEKLSDPDLYYTIGSLANMLGITHDRLCIYRKSIPAFDEAVKQGIIAQEANQAHALAMGLGNVTGRIFMLKNSVHRYADKIENKHEVSLADVLAKQSEVTRLDWEATPPLPPAEEEGE